MTRHCWQAVERWNTDPNVLSTVRHDFPSWSPFANTGMELWTQLLIVMERVQVKQMCLKGFLDSRVFALYDYMCILLFLHGSAM